MERDTLSTTILALIVGFGLGWFTGMVCEQKKYDYYFRTPSLEIRVPRDYQKPNQYPQKRDSNISVWPWVDIETRPRN